jgi:patatin-like phospholipase/acyl hydrolase
MQNPRLANNVLIADVARATTATPTYFKKKVINKQEYIDGGFSTNANNPS